MSLVTSLLRWAAVAALLVLSVPQLIGCKKSARNGRSNAEREAASTDGVGPSRDLSPADVVRIQIQSLSKTQNNTSGIRTAFRFSSPQHRVLTGSLSDFRDLMDAPEFRPLRVFVEVDYFEPEIEGDQARLIVALTDASGETSFYLFELSRQTYGDFRGCWMTDAVQTSMYKIQSELSSSAST